MNLTVNGHSSVNIYNNTSFTSKLYNARTLQNIPDIACACCGHKVIRPESVAQAYAKVSKPLTEVLQKGILDKWKDVPTVWYLLNYLAKKNPQDSLDTIIQSDDKNFRQLRTTISADVNLTYTKEDLNTRKHLSKNAYRDLIYASRSELMPASTVMTVFEKFKKYLNGAPLKAFEKLQIYAQKNSDKTLSEIVNSQDIYQYHELKSSVQTREFFEKIDFHFYNIMKLINDENPLAIEYFKKISNMARSIYFTEHDDTMRLPLMREKYNGAMKVLHCEHLAKQIYNELEQLPKTHRTEDDYFVYAADNKYTDMKIILDIIAPFIGSFEHIIPRSKSGSDSIYNGIVMCRSCNNERGTRQYSDFIQFHPKMQKNVMRQVQYISKLILAGKIEDEAFNRWPVMVTKTLSEYTDGLINIPTANYSEKIVDVIRNKIQKKENVIENLTEQAQEISAEKQVLVSKIKKLNNERKLVVDEIQDVQKSLSANKNDLEYFEMINNGTESSSEESEIAIQNIEDFEDYGSV